MWKNWNPFRRKPKEDVDQNNDISKGKDDTAGSITGTNEMECQGGRGDAKAIDHNDVGYKHSQQNVDRNNLYPYGHKSGYSHSADEQNGVLAQFRPLHNTAEDLSLRLPSERRIKCQQTVSSVVQDTREMGNHDQWSIDRQNSQLANNSYRSIVSPFSEDKQSPRLSKVSSENRSFTGVHGPLLSSPIIPKVRKALETSAGLRSPQLLSGRKNAGRSASLNYGSHNPTRSTAGQVPWVRLKRKDSITLSDIVRGNTPQSPNTVRLAAPDHRHLPAAPSFKTTPLIVTTEPHVVDTQTVVLALREKRKRFCTNLQDESHGDDSWANGAKRRRQDSSQSNASSVSIPPMPESLPNLMGTPRASLLHIENLTDQRPSTVPAMDAYISHHQRELGLGGDRSCFRPQQLKRQQQQENSGIQNNSKSVLRSIQSSLSSSLRARANLSLLQQGGADMKRICQSAQIRDTTSPMSVSSDISLKDQSFEEPPAKKSVQNLETTTAATKAVTSLAISSSLQNNTNQSALPAASMPVKRKIAEGVVLRKHNLSLGAASSPAKPIKVLPASTLVSTIDFERDKQNEYQRRVLDILDNENPSAKSVSQSVQAVTALNAPITSTTVLIPSLFPMTSSSRVGTEASLAATTSAAVSASLDSLNKLVQSATAPVVSTTGPGGITSVTTANTLSQLLNPDKGNPLISPNPATGVEERTASSDSISLASTAAPISSSPSTFVTPSTARGLSFGALAPITQSDAVPSAPKFQMNSNAPVFTGFQFGTVSSAAATTTSSISSNAGGPTSGGGFSFGAPEIVKPETSINTSNISSTFASGSAFAAGIQTPVTSIGGLGTFVTNQILSSTRIQQPSAISQPSQILGTSFIVSNAATTNESTNASLLQSGGFTFLPLSSQQPTKVSQVSSSASNPKPAATITTFSTSAPGFNFAGNTTPFSSIVAATTNQPTSATGSAGFSVPGSTATPSAGFNFGASTSQPSFNFGTVSSVSAAATTAQTSGFTFGIPASVNNPVPQAQSGFSFDLSTSKPNIVNPLGTTTTAASGGQASSFILGSSGFSGQTQGFKGFVANTPATTLSGFAGSTLQPQGMSRVSPSPSPNQLSGVVGFGSGSQQAQQSQQPFGVTPTFSAFGATTATTTTTAGGGIFAFGQPSVGTTASKPFTFGVTSTQSGATNLSGVTVTTPACTSSMFGNVGTTSAPAIFGSDSAPLFGSIMATSPFGSSAMATSLPAFRPPVGTPAFGTGTNNQTASVFGATTSQSNQPFTFIMPTQSVQQQPSNFGSNPTPAFGNMTPATGSSMFGAKSTPPVFGTTTTSVGPAFGTSSQTTTTSVPSLVFGSTFGSSTAFGGVPTQQPKSFGVAFGGTAPAAAFGVNTQNTAFGANTPNTAFGANTQNTGFGANTPNNGFGANTPNTAFGANTPNTGFGANTPNTGFGANTPNTAFGQNSVFGSTTQNVASHFGAQSTVNQAPNSNLFGNIPPVSGSVNVFGASKPNPFGAPATTQGGFNFTAGQAQTATTFGTQAANSGSSGFNFGQAISQPGTAPGVFNFAAQAQARPTFQSPPSGGFNFSTAAAAAGANFNFAASPTPNLFTMSTPTAATRPRGAARRGTRRIPRK